MANNNEKLCQEPAFASACANEQSHHIETGMSKRFYAACAAMQGLLHYGGRVDNIEVLVKDAYAFADELLKQENE